MLFRYYTKTGGDHTHVKVWAGKNPAGLGLVGSLVFRNEEFKAFKEMLEKQRGVTFHEQLISGLMETPQP